MLASTNRFHGHGSLRYVYKNGKAIRGHYVTIKYAANSRRSTPRVAVVISKKVLKSAVGRNRVRRRIYESLRQNTNLAALGGCDIVYIVTSPEVRVMPAENLAELTNSSLTEMITNVSGE